MDITKKKSMEMRIEQQAKELEQTEAELKTTVVELKQTKELLESELNSMSRLHSISTRFVQEQDLSSLLDEIIDAAVSITNADICTIQLFDPKTYALKVIAQRGLPENFIKHIDRIHNGETVLGKEVKNENHMIWDDITQNLDSMGPGGKAAMQSIGVHSFQSAPLMSRSGKKLGILAMLFKQPHKSAERDCRLLDLLARLTADIMERVQSKAELQRSNRGTELLYEIVEKLLVGNNMQSIIQEYCTKVMEFLDCDIFINYLFTKNNDRLKLNTFAGLPKEKAGSFEWLDPGQDVCTCVAVEGCKMVVENIQSNSNSSVEKLKPLGIRAFACHPLTVQDEVLGTLAFGTCTRNVFTADELALMKAVSSHVAVALHRLQNEEALRKLTEELSDKNRLVTDFFTNISHEFKTPLSIILVDLQLMEYRLREVNGETREKLGKMVSVMRQNALRLLRLIGNLLDVTKIDAGFMRTRLINIDITCLVAELVESVRNYAENAGIEISFVSDRHSMLMPMDSEKMERVILNLLSNAIKHTNEGGHIRVGLISNEDSITLSVKDDGEGIPDDKKEYIFDRFRQVNTSLTRSSEGCGIGLSLTKALVELMQGRIWFESTLGRGSEFFIRLPVLEANERGRTPEIEGMPRNRKVEMEFSDIHKTGKQA